MITIELTDEQAQFIAIILSEYRNNFQKKADLSNVSLKILTEAFKRENEKNGKEKTEN